MAQHGGAGQHVGPGPGQLQRVDALIKDASALARLEAPWLETTADDEVVVHSDAEGRMVLADTLGRKMRKILDRQLALGQHPAAAGLLPRPLVAERRKLM